MKKKTVIISIGLVVAVVIGLIAFDVISLDFLKKKKKPKQIFKEEPSPKRYPSKTEKKIVSKREQRLKEEAIRKAEGEAEEREQIERQRERRV